MRRNIKSNATTRSQQLLDALQTVFALEMLVPSDRIFLHFAWISDINVIDNTFGQFRTLLPDQIGGQVRLSDYLNELAERGTRVHIMTRGDDPTTAAFLARLRLDPATIRTASNFHEKTMVTAHLVLKGSMNLTYFGTQRNYEDVTVSSDLDDIARELNEAEQLWSQG